MGLKIMASTSYSMAWRPYWILYKFTYSFKSLWRGESHRNEGNSFKSTFFYMKESKQINTYLYCAHLFSATQNTNFCFSCWYSLPWRWHAQWPNHLCHECTGLQNPQVDLEDKGRLPLNMAFLVDPSDLVVPAHLPAVSVVLDRSQHNTALPLAPSDLVAQPLLQASTEPLVPPAVLVAPVLCQPSMAPLVPPAVLVAPVLCQPSMAPLDFQAVSAVLAPCHLSSETLVLPADLEEPTLCQRSTVLRQPLADWPPHSTLLGVDMLLQEEGTMPRRTTWL
jgi:hypothetical protein